MNLASQSHRFLHSSMRTPANELLHGRRLPTGSAYKYCGIGSIWGNLGDNQTASFSAATFTLFRREVSVAFGHARVAVTDFQLYDFPRRPSLAKTSFPRCYGPKLTSGRGSLSTRPRFWSLLRLKVDGLLREEHHKTILEPIGVRGKVVLTF